MENMEVIEKEGIKNKSQFTNKEIIDGLLFMTNNNKKLWIVMIILGIAFIGLYFAKLELFIDINSMFLSVGIGVTLISILMLFILPVIVKRNNNNFKDGMIYEYEFYDSEFKVDSILTGQTSSAVIKYNSLYKTIENNNNLYIYISKSQCYILKLDGFNSVDDKNKVLALLNTNKK